LSTPKKLKADSAIEAPTLDNLLRAASVNLAGVAVWNIKAPAPKLVDTIKLAQDKGATEALVPSLLLLADLHKINQPAISKADLEPSLAATSLIKPGYCLKPNFCADIYCTI
jgi:hypothetical protein